MPPIPETPARPAYEASGRPDPEHQRLVALLEENLALAKENNKLLKTMRRSALFWLIAKIVIWGALLILPLFFIQPLISAFTGELPDGTATGTAPSLFGFPSPSEVHNLVKQYQDLSN